MASIWERSNRKLQHLTFGLCGIRMIGQPQTYRLFHEWPKLSVVHTSALKAKPARLTGTTTASRSAKHAFKAQCALGTQPKQQICFTSPASNDPKLADARHL